MDKDNEKNILLKISESLEKINDRLEDIFSMQIISEPKASPSVKKQCAQYIKSPEGLEEIKMFRDDIF